MATTRIAAHLFQNRHQLSDRKHDACHENNDTAAYRYSTYPTRRDQIQMKKAENKIRFAVFQENGCNMPAGKMYTI